MATITIELDETTAGLFEVQGIVQGLRAVLDLLPHQHTVNFRMEDDDTEPVEDPPTVDAPTYVVEVNDRYTYLVEPSEVERQITVGDEVDLPGQYEGAHWQGHVTRVMSVDHFEDTEGELPSRKVIGLW